MMVALIAAYLGCLSGCASVSKIPMQPPKLHSNVTPPSYTQMLHLQVTQMLPQITSGYTSVSKIPMQPPKLHSNVTPPSYTQMLHLQVTQMLPQITSGYTSVSKIPKQPPKILYTSHFTSIPTQ